MHGPAKMAIHGCTNLAYNMPYITILNYMPIYKNKYVITIYTLSLQANNTIEFSIYRKISASTFVPHIIELR